MRFLQALKDFAGSGAYPIIPDIKAFSPKEGELLRGRDPAALAGALAGAGAPALSVVTEEREFHGSMDMLRRVCERVSIPVLCKDFIESREDLAATRAAGASAVLLMCACLEREKLISLYREAMGMGLDVLLETHTEAEMALARELGAPLVGVNNRSILELERDEGDVSLSCALARLAPPGALVVSESGLRDKADVERALGAGAHAALMGTAILQAEDAALFYRGLRRRLHVKICGLMNREDAALCARYGADMLGFVVDYPAPVPWNLEAARAKELMGGFKSCVVTGGGRDRILRLARELSPRAVQLHYRESLREASDIAAELKGAGIAVIKTIPPSPAERMAQFGTADGAEIVKRAGDSAVSALLLDPRGPEAPGQSGSAPLMEFKRLRRLSHKPLILAGGIKAQNLGALCRESGAQYIDLMTATEDGPGHKSEEKISALMNAAGGILE